HPGIRVHCAYGMTRCLVLLDDGEMALIVFRATLAAIEQELSQRNVTVSSPAAFDLVDEAAEAHQRLLHLLMSVEPLLFGRGSDVIRPAVCKFPGRVVQACILVFGHHVVVDGGFEKIAGNVALVIGASARLPSFGPCDARTPWTVVVGPGR